jgi:HEAT repeat protein
MAGGAPLAEAARESLGEVFGDGVDEAIVVAMQKATIDLRAALIEILSDRGASTAVPALLAEAEHKDAGIRTRAVKALGNIAEPKNVPAVVALLLKTAKGRQRDDLEKAVMLVCNRTPQAGDRADPVIAFIARSGDEDRCTLLPLLGRIGGAKAAAEVRRAIKSGNADIREAGVRALCNWPDAAVADQLLDLARETDNQTHKTWALRAYIRVATLRSDQAPSETLGALKKAMAMADRADEKKLVLSRASAARHVDTLRWLTPFLDDSVLSAEACKAVVDLAHHRDLMGPHQAEFRKALEKVIAVSSDQGLIERARQYMSGL